MIGRFFGWLWSVARYFPTQAPGIRFGSASSALLTFLFFVFFIAGLILVLLGFDIGEVEDWLDRHADLFDLIGTILFKGLLVFVLAICGLVVGATVYGWFAKRTPGQPKEAGPGGCLTLAAIAIGYACVVGIFFL